MYLVGKLELDPSQETEIKKLKSSSAFGKLIDVLSFGQAGKKEEKETFTAVAFLDKIYSALKSIKVNNIVRLAVDDYDFYYDDAGDEADLETAFDHFKIKVDPIESELFETIYLVLEHDYEGLKLLIEIQFNRKHPVGEYPVIININAVTKDFDASGANDIDSLKNKMKNIFNNQKEYEDYVDRQKRVFNSFLDKFIFAIKKNIPLDDFRMETSVQIIRPKGKLKKKNDIKHVKKSKPVYYGYYGFDDYFYYTWLWGDMMHEHNIYTHDVDIVDEDGNEVMHVGENGFDAGDVDTLNTDAPFEPVQSDDIQYYPDNKFADDIEDSGIKFDDDITDDSDSTDFSDDDGDFDFDD